MRLHSFTMKVCAVAMAMGSLTSCHTKEASKDIIQDNVDNAVAQLTLQTDIIEKSGKFLNPRTYEKGKMNYVPIDDWCSGFFPGTLWYTYELTGDKKWEKSFLSPYLCISFLSYLSIFILRIFKHHPHTSISLAFMPNDASFLHCRQIAFYCTLCHRQCFRHFFSCD